MSDLKHLATALVKAQAEAQAITKSKTNEHFRFAYAPMESFIAEGKRVLALHGLALIPGNEDFFFGPEKSATRLGKGGEVVGESKAPSMVLKHTYLLVHAESGETHEMRRETPVVPEKGRPEDKQTSAVRTQDLGYLIRDLLLIPRVLPGEEIDAQGARERLLDDEPVVIEEESPNTSVSDGGAGGANPPGVASASPSAPDCRMGTVLAEAFAELGGGSEEAMAKACLPSSLPDGTPAPGALVKALCTKAKGVYGGKKSSVRAAWLVAGVSPETYATWWSDDIIPANAPRGKQVRAFVEALARYNPDTKKDKGNGEAGVLESAPGSAWKESA